MNEQQEYRITGIDIPFFDMVVFMVKAALASIPAAMILGVIGLLLTLLFIGVTGMAS